MTGASVATAGLFFTFVIPIYLQTKTNELVSLEKKVAEQVVVIDEHVEKEKTFNSLIQKQAEEITKLSDLLAFSHLSNLFTRGSPYPAGFGKVMIGEPLEVVSEVYLEENIRKESDEDGGFWSVKLPNHSFFESVTYYYDDEEKNRIITHISFSYPHPNQVKGDKNKKLISDKLYENLGKPIVWKNGVWKAWPTEMGVTVYLDPLNSVTLMNSDMRPGYWPEYEDEQRLKD